MGVELAQRLNELAQANSEGLLSDDEYRLLRQSAFEQYANGLDVPAEVPAVPIAVIYYGLESPQKKSAKSVPLQAYKPPSADSHPSRLSSFIRRAAGRNDRNAPRDRPSTADGRFHEPSPSETGTRDNKRTLLPRLFQKKPADLPPLRITSPTKPNPHSPQPLPNLPPPPKSPPPTPGRLSTKSSRPSSSSRSTSSQTPLPISPLSPTKFDDPATSRDIRDSIAYTESELERLKEAFDVLEQGVIRRINKQHARRLPATTPTNMNILLEGREWREHRVGPSPSTPSFESSRTLGHRPNALDHVNDGLSVHSGRSGRASLSQSKSIASLPKHPPPSSPLSSLGQAPFLQRKGSISSVCSRGTSFGPRNRLATSVASLSNLSHSASLLPTPPATVRGSSEEDRHYLDELEQETDSNLSELGVIQQRKSEMIARYTQRIEYLRAKLKGAELHEKLLRK
ncbi:hypothetical protein FA15DRAFT_665694 [Coprinopsis marcescibilis]|uniref:Uncharacterized protein n=1 Tax=Coprinopsis marcescibilis TaxID=230819 RepID=A0A5C3L656_COPMA|nr:hypothetical protein FA15DRAFT_665694 [Coprinopsis marcescibilis]